MGACGVSTVYLGSNRFVDCHALLGLREQPVLAIRTEPLRVDMVVPAGLPSGITFEVRDNAIVQRPGQAIQQLQVIPQATSVGIFWGNVPLVIAVLGDASTVHVRVDLRPLGILFYDDAEGLHVGTNVFGGNGFANCATAIALG